MTKEALKMAREALEGVLDDAPKVLEASITGGLYEVIQCRDAITAIKEALAQPEQEPVAWLTEERYAQLHTAQRTWVGLANHDWNSTAYSTEFRAGAEWAEAKLKEKNSG